MWTKHKFEHNESQKLFLVSDTHFCHDKDFIFGKRGFESIEEHDRNLIETWNTRVAPTDTVIHLGDFLVGAGNGAEKITESLLSRLHGNKILLWGNHNSGVLTIYRKIIKEKGLDVYGDKTEVYPLTTDQFGAPVTFVGNNLLGQVKTPKDSQLIFCSHFAHRIWINAPRDSEILHFSGHSHGTDPESQPEWLGCKRLDVGIENFGGPIDFSDALAVMNKKTANSIDHH